MARPDSPQRQALADAAAQLAADTSVTAAIRDTGGGVPGVMTAEELWGQLDHLREAVTVVIGLVDAVLPAESDVFRRAELIDQVERMRRDTDRINRLRDTRPV